MTDLQAIIAMASLINCKILAEIISNRKSCFGCGEVASHERKQPAVPAPSSDKPSPRMSNDDFLKDKPKTIIDPNVRL